MLLIVEFYGEFTLKCQRLVSLLIFILILLEEERARKWS